MIRLALILLTIVVLGSVASAQDTAFGPIVPKSTGEPHPEGNEFWRINHMELLTHDRDKTVIYGDREVTASLSGCIDCHAVQGADAQPVSIKSEKHFCRVCHDYAAVKVDCFQCHNSRPEGEAHAVLLNPTLTLAMHSAGQDQSTALSEIVNYLDEAQE